MDLFYDGYDEPAGLGMSGPLSGADATFPALQPAARLSELAAADADGIVVIDNQEVILDSADVEGILVSGPDARLFADDSETVDVVANWILVVNGGAFEVGTATDPFENDLTLTLRTDDMGRDVDVAGLLGGGMGMPVMDNDGYLMAMGEGSRIGLHAADAAKESWTQLRQTVERGDTVLYLDEATGWQAGDRIALAPTGILHDQSEEFGILEVRDNGREIVLDGQIMHTHYGAVENHSNGKSGDDARAWDVDLRGEVALLSRNVTVQGDADSALDGLGAHTMAMMGAVKQIEGVEFTRVGQQDILGRYPVHWHMLGDTDGEDQYLRKSSIHNSFQKAITIHGTNDVTVHDNVGYDHVGHGLFMEDGSENDNVITDNLIFGTRASLTGQPIPTDRTDPSSFWIENPNNTFIGNHAAGSEVHGFRFAPALVPHGLSAAAFPDAAGQMSDLVFRDNTVHSSAQGLFIEGQVNPLTLELEQTRVETGDYTIEGFTAYKIGGAAIWIVGTGATVADARLADTLEPVFFEQTNMLRDTIVIADSGNTTDDDITLPVEAGGVRLYRDAQSGLDSVHFVNFDGTTDAITVRTSISQDTPSWSTNLTFDNTPMENRFGFEARDGVADKPTNRFLDIDGSLTGHAGGILTPDTAGIGSFAATSNGVFVEAFDAWLSPDSNVAVAQLAFRDGIGSIGGLTVTRSDGEVLVNPFGPSSFILHFAAATSLETEYVYTLDFVRTPTAMEFGVEGLREGESLTYRMEANAGFRQKLAGAAPVMDSLDALMASAGSALYHDGTYLYVRLVGGAPEPDGGAQSSYSSSAALQIGYLDQSSASVRPNGGFPWPSWLPWQPFGTAREEFEMDTAEADVVPRTSLALASVRKLFA